MRPMGCFRLNFEACTRLCWKICLLCLCLKKLLFKPLNKPISFWSGQKKLTQQSNKMAVQCALHCTLQSVPTFQDNFPTIPLFGQFSGYCIALVAHQLQIFRGQLGFQNSIALVIVTFLIVMKDNQGRRKSHYFR